MSNRNLSDLPEATNIGSGDLFHIRQAGTDRNVPASVLFELMPAGDPGPQGPQGAQGPPGSAGPAGGTQCLGSFDAPLGETISYPSPSTDEIDNPLLAIRLTESSGVPTLSGMGISWIKIATDKIYQSEEAGRVWFRFFFHEEQVRLSIHPTETDADNNTGTLAEALVNSPESASGVFPLLDGSDGETVWGWIWVPDGISAAPGANTTRQDYLDDFALSVDRWVPGAEVRIRNLISFENGSDAPTLDFSVKLVDDDGYGNDYALGSFSYPLGELYGTEASLLEVETVIKCIGTEFDQYGGLIHHFRTTQKLVFHANDSYSPGAVTFVKQAESTHELEGAVQFLTLHEHADDGEGNPIETFALYESSAEFRPAPSFQGLV